MSNIIDTKSDELAAWPLLSGCGGSTMKGVRYGKSG
jgi:hypothetical protein